MCLWQWQYSPSPLRVAPVLSWAHACALRLIPSLPPLPPTPPTPKTPTFCPCWQAVSSTYPGHCTLPWVNLGLMPALPHCLRSSPTAPSPASRHPRPRPLPGPSGDDQHIHVACALFLILFPITIAEVIMLQSKGIITALYDFALVSKFRAGCRRWKESVVFCCDNVVYACPPCN